MFWRPTSLPPSLRFPLRVVFTLLFAWVFAWLFARWRVPLPWMIGPLVATGLASMWGAPTLSWTPLRNAGQWVIGAALGLYFTPQVMALVGSLWWAIALCVAWALLLGYGFGRWLHYANAPHLPQLDRATTFFAGAIGGASEMTLLAEREMARTDLVASAHSLRLLIVTVSLPFAMQLSGWHALDAVPPLVREFSGAGLAQLALWTGFGSLLMQWLKRANPWFMGSLLVSMGFAMQGITLSGIPSPLSNAAQLVIGVSLGVRFTAGFVRTAPRWLATVALGTLVMLVTCAGVGALLAWATGLPLATMLLATAPGGIAEMAITAKVLQLGVALVTAFQVCRLLIVLVGAGPLYRYLYGGQSCRG